MRHCALNFGYLSVHVEASRCVAFVVCRLHVLVGLAAQQTTPPLRRWIVPVIAGTAGAVVVAVVAGVIIALSAEPPVDGSYSLGVLREPAR